MFKLGERVFDIRYGWGIVLDTNDGLQVEFISEICEYTIDGRDSPNAPITLYHHDYTPTETQELNVCESETLTKREKFAGMAMQGILAGRNREAVTEIRGLVEIAIECAEELIKALNEKP